MANMRMVKVTNRSSKKLEYIVDGIPWVFQPGDPDDNQVPSFVAEMARRKSAVMGTENPGDPSDCEYLLAVKKWGQDCSPMEQSDAKERLDRSQLDEDRQVVERRIPPGLRPRVEAEEGKGSPRLRQMATPSGPGDPRITVIETDPNYISNQ